MTTTLSEPDGPREQHNHSNGLFVGGNNYGTIEMVDEKTKSALRKLSKDAPQLGNLLSRALEDGVISPGTVLALETAARSINEDVTAALWTASRNINEDVAGWLLDASRGINENVAGMFLHAAQEVRESAQSITEATRQLQSFRFPAAASPVPAIQNVQPARDQYLRTVTTSLMQKVDRIERSVGSTQAMIFAAGFVLGVFATILVALAV
ncbi:hypothetical protein ACNAW0_28655 [Micromonospora sp. SL1-18]|uniref:hypothetical protein n=1 Tax=Micromonospora sp. SL1-18 TaxID=3399128 RepID=UPI003A4D4FBB